MLTCCVYICWGGLCPECSFKLNYGQKRKEVTKPDRKHKRRKVAKRRTQDEAGPSDATDAEAKPEEPEENVWKAPVQEVADAKPIEEEFDEYLEDLFL